ncbi:MAG: hypothetical protein C4523_20720 [Myxococcales bacterium]|nr:MAG: hypothetical protein C4523_20720 [Myxococcales bacterium]
MNCRDADKYLLAYIDGEFDGAESSEIEQHFKFCPACRRKVEFELWFKRGVKTANPPEVRAPASLRAAVHRTYREEQVRRIPWALKLAPAAAVVLVFAWIFFQPSIDISMPIVEASVDRHTDNTPFDVQSPDPKQVADYFTTRIKYAVRLPQFRHTNLELLGGRVATLRDAPVAYVAYQGNGRRYSIIAAPGLDRLPVIPESVRMRVNNRDVVITRHNGFLVVLWRAGDMVYSITSNDDESEVVDLVADAEFD